MHPLDSSVASCSLHMTCKGLCAMKVFHTLFNTQLEQLIYV